MEKKHSYSHPALQFLIIQKNVNAKQSVKCIYIFTSIPKYHYIHIMWLCFTKLCQWSLFQACDRQLSTVSWKVPTLISKIKDFFLFWDYTEVKTTSNQHNDYFDSLQGEKKLKNYHCCWSFTSPEQLCRPAKSLNIFILFWQMLLSHQTIHNWNMLHVAQQVTLLPWQLWVLGHHFSVPRPSSGKTNFPGEGQPSKSKH